MHQAKPTRKSIVAASASSLLLLALLAGCTPGPGPSESETPAPSAEGTCPATDDKIKVTIAATGGLTGFSTGFALGIAEMTGLWEEHGIDLEVVTVASASEANAGLMSGSVDFALSDSSGMIQQIQGAPLTALTPTMEASIFSVVARADRVQDWADLEGKTMGVGATTGIVVSVLNMMKADAGLSPDSVQLIVAGRNPDRFQALLAGQIDATIVPPPWGLTDDPSLIVLGDHVPGSSLPLITSGYIASTERVQAEEADKAVRFLGLWIDAVRWVKDPANRAELQTLATELVGQPAPIVSASLAYYLDNPEMASYFLPESGEFNETAMDNLMASFVEFDSIEQAVDPAELIDSTLVRRALSCLDAG